MRSLTICLIVFSLIAVSGCSSGVKVGYNENTNFHVLKTYAWSQITPTELEDTTVSNAKAAVNRQLAAKGLKEVSANPDFYINLDIDRKLVWYKDNSWPELRYRYMPYTSRGALAWSKQYEKQLLTLNLVSAETQKVVWHGEVKKTLDPVQTDATEENQISDSVSKMLVNYPPPQIKH